MNGIAPTHWYSESFRVGEVGGSRSYETDRKLTKTPWHPPVRVVVTVLSGKARGFVGFPRKRRRSVANERERRAHEAAVPNVLSAPWPTPAPARHFLSSRLASTVSTRLTMRDVAIGA